MSPTSRVRWRASGRIRQAFGLLLLLALPGGAQNSPFTGPFMWPPDQPGADSQNSRGGLDPIMEEKRLRALNAERQRSLVSDTDKLLKLAHELNDEVNVTKPDSLDSEELTQVAEIEKLAHKVKEKMSTPVQGTTDFQPFPSRQY